MLDHFQSSYSTHRKLNPQFSLTFILCLVVCSHSSAPVALSSYILNQNTASYNLPFLLTEEKRCSIHSCTLGNWRESDSSSSNGPRWNFGQWQTYMPEMTSNLKHRCMEELLCAVHFGSYPVLAYIEAERTPLQNITLLIVTSTSDWASEFNTPSCIKNSSSLYQSGICIREQKPCLCAMEPLIDAQTLKSLSCPQS